MSDTVALALIAALAPILASLVHLSIRITANKRRIRALTSAVEAASR